MGRASKPLTACVIALTLLAGVSGAIAAADPGDPETGESTSVGESGSGGDQSADPADHTDPHPYASPDNGRTDGTQSGDVGPDDTEESPEPIDEQDSEKKPADSDSGSDYDRDKTINRIPVQIPEAPPVVDLGPIPEELPPIPLEPMPPVDLPPVLPAAPQPDVVDVATAGASEARPDGYEPHVLTVPVIVAPVPAPPPHILGASVTAPRTSGVRATTPPSRGESAPAPSIRQTTTSEPLLGEPPPANIGLTTRGQPPNRTGFNADVRSGRLGETAAGALPGVAGLMIITASGICIGYRQAMATRRLQPQGADRFLA